MAAKLTAGERPQSRHKPAPPLAQVEAAALAVAATEKFPDTFAEALKLLQARSRETVANEEEWDAKQPLLLALKAHVFKLQQGLPVVHTSANDLAECHVRRDAGMKELKLQALGRSHREVAELLAERDTLVAAANVKAEIKPEALAGQLYDAYCAAVGGKAFNGDLLPAWVEFSADEKKRKQVEAWVATATLAQTLLLGKTESE